MEYNHEDSWQKFEEILSYEIPAIEKWHQLVDYHIKKGDNEIAVLLKGIDVDNDVTELRDWLKGTFEQEPIPIGIVGLWFGIFKMLKDENELYVVYCAGSNQYNKNDVEWASEPDYQPRDSYFVADGLNELLRIITGSGDDFAFFDWIFPLAYCSFAFSEVIMDKKAKDMGLDVDQIHVVCGYDDGDYIELTKLDI